MAYNSNQKDKSHENRFNSTFSREPVYGEGITTNYERGHDLRNLQESLEKGSLSSVLLRVRPYFWRPPLFSVAI